MRKSLSKVADVLLYQTQSKRVFNMKRTTLRHKKATHINVTERAGWKVITT